MSANEKIPIAIVGAGTVGSVLAGHFIRSGHEKIAIVDIPARIAQIKQRGIQISDVGAIQVDPDCLFDDIAKLADRNIDTLFVATKTTHLPVVAPKLREIHKPGMQIVSFQNGIGTEHFLAKFIDPSHVARVTVNFAGVRDEDKGDVSMSWFHPPNFLGPYYEQDLAPYTKLAALMTSIGLETRAVSHQEIKRQVFYKTILNAALNALCATTGLTMSQAMRMRHTRHLARQLLREALTVASFMGFNYGEDVLEMCMGYLDKGGDHYPSMWSDLHHKRRTEIDYINGKIVKCAMMFSNCDVGRNMFFVSMVMTEEIRSGVRSEDEVPPYLGCNVRLCY
jgi:2-dehydropantoate 2-reductase